MKIGIDISQIAHKGTGVARYTQTLIESLLNYDKDNEYVFFFSSLRQNLSEKNITNITKRHLLKRYFLPPTVLNILWNKLHIVPIEKFTGPLDVFLTSDWVEPPAKCKKITTIHDMVIEKYPETSHPNIISTQKLRLQWVKKESDITICDSISTKNDVMKYLAIPEKKLRVIYPAVNSFPVSIKKDGDILQSYNIKKPYILTIGKFEPRKNINALINAFSKSNVKDLNLYIAGIKGWGSNYNTNNVNNDHIHFLGYIDDKDIAIIYKNAEFFIYPSLYEGFGYPIVEAMMNGCPVATANTSSMNEIANGYSYLFNPKNEMEMTKAINELYNNPKLRKELSKKGLARAKDFSMKHFASKLISVINELI